MFQKIASTFFIKVLVAIINFLIVICISRWLGAAGKGETSLIITSIVFIIFFCNIIGGDTLVYLASRYNLLQLLILSSLWSAIVCTIAYFLLTSFHLVSEKYIFSIVLLSFINALFSANIILLLGLNKILQINIITLLQTAINLVSIVLLIYFLNQKNYWSFINSLYISYSFALLASFISLYKHIKFDTIKKTKKLFKEMLQLGFANQIGHILGFLNFRISYYLLDYFNGKESVGIYSNGTSIAESLWLISNSIAMVQYAKIANSNNKASSQQLTIQLIKFSTVLCLVASLILILLPTSFFVMLFGKEFSTVKLVILLLIPGVIFNNLFLIISHYFSGIGKYKISTIGNLVGFVITVVLSFSFILYSSQYSLTLAAVISSCSYIATCIFILIVFLKSANIALKDLLPQKNDWLFLKNESLKMYSKKN